MDGSSRPAPDGYLKRHKLDAATLPFYVLGLANITVLVGVAPSQILLGLGLAVLLFGRWFVKRPRTAGTPAASELGIEAPFPAAILGLYFVWTLVSLAFSPSPAGISQFGAIRKFFVFLILPAGYTAFRLRADRDSILKWTFVASAAAGLLGLVQFGLYYRALSSATDFYSAYAKARIIGFMGHWQTFSGQQMLALTMLLALLLHARKRSRWMWACAGLIALSLLFSLTRGAWLGFLAAALYLLWPFGRRWIMAVPLAVLLLFLAAPPFFRERILSFTDLRSDSSNQARVLMLRTGRRMIAAHPLVGVGPNGVEYAFAAYLPPDQVPENWQKLGWYGHLHSDYVQIAAERGLPAVALFVWFVLVVFRDQRRLAARLPVERRYVSHGVAAAVVAMAVSGAFEYNFSDSEVAMLLLFFIAHGYAAARETAGAADTAGVAAPAA